MGWVIWSEVVSANVQSLEKLSARVDLDSKDEDLKCQSIM